MAKPSADALIAKLDALQKTAHDKLPAIKTAENPSDELEKLRVDWLGKKGALTEIMKDLGGLTAEERPQVGAKANAVRGEITERIETMSSELKGAELGKKMAAESVDVTLPGRKPRPVAEHPIEFVLDELVAIFERAGFLPEIGPEVEHEFYNFDALNIPSNHPSRAMQDTFYVKDRAQKVVLRTHTSPVQIRTMLGLKPPIRMTCPGKVFRSDYDATHSPVFHQIEGLWIDTDVHMGDLKTVLAILVSQFFGTQLNVRLRPSYFPFTEPSAEVDMQCAFCKGTGCKTCKGSGWVEIGGCGMVDPEVFKSVQLDPEKYKGFAFGMGIERMAMLKYGVNDLRAFFESDYRFISQFARWRPE